MPRNTRLLRESFFSHIFHGSSLDGCTAREMMNRREADKLGITIRYNLL